MSLSDKEKKAVDGGVAEIDLKTCPCCGGAAWLDKCESRDRNADFGGVIRTYWSVRCRQCDLRTPAIANPDTPMTIWNKRANNPK